MQYEGPKSEVIQGFKDQGNDMVKVKRWKDAKEFYSKGVLVLSSKLDGKWDKPDDEDDERVKLKILGEQIYVNRALCNLELSELLLSSTKPVLRDTENYRATTLDCFAALKINPNNVKAHYRSALALLALDKVHEALDICHRGINLDDANAPMQKLLERIQSRAAVMEQQMRNREAEEQRKFQEKRMLETALTARKIQVRGSKHPPNLEDSEIRLSPNPLSLKSLLEFPIMLLYPLHNQSDFIKAAAENRSLSDHLSYILPLPWDEKGEYKAPRVDCYMDTTSGGMIKVGKKLTLLEVLSNGKTEVVDSLVRVHVVPTLLAPEWLAEVKRKKGM